MRGLKDEYVPLTAIASTSSRSPSGVPYPLGINGHNASLMRIDYIFRREGDVRPLDTQIENHKIKCNAEKLFPEPFS